MFCSKCGVQNEDNDRFCKECGERLERTEYSHATDVIIQKRESSYNKGIEDGLALWGRVCGRQGACESCPVGAMRGANVTCQDFARQFPEKMVSLLQEMDKKGSTFYEEYCTRFPECNIPIEDLAHVACRKVLFEGFIFCEKTDDMSACIACWNEKYKGDITVTDMDEYNGENYTMSVESTHE